MVFFFFVFVFYRKNVAFVDILMRSLVNVAGHTVSCINGQSVIATHRIVCDALFIQSTYQEYIRASVVSYFFFFS